MSISKPTRAAFSLASGVVVGAGGVQRYARANTGWDALLTAKITNGATGPTTACQIRLYVAHTTGATPAVGAEGADWKLVRTVGYGPLAANQSMPFAFEIPLHASHYQIEFSGHTGQAVTVSLEGSEITDITTT